MKWKVYSKLMRAEWRDEKPVQPKRNLRYMEKPPLVPVEIEYGEDAEGEYKLSLEELPLIDFLPRSNVPGIKLKSLQYWLDHLGPAIYNPLRAYRYENGELLFTTDGGHRTRCLWEIGEPLVRVLIRESLKIPFTTRKYRRHYARYNIKVKETNQHPPTVTHFLINPDMVWRQYYPCIYPHPKKHQPYVDRFFKERSDGIYFKDTLDSPMSFREIISQNKALSYRLDIFDAIKAHGLDEKTIIDVGSYFGHYSFLSLEAGAYRAVGVEFSKFRAMMAFIIARRRGFGKWNNRFVGHYKKIHEYLQGTDEVFDYAYVLNVFHHLLKQNPEQGWDTINTLLDRTNQLFLLTGNKWNVFGEWEGDIEKAIREKTGATIQPLIKTRYRNRTLYLVER